MKKRAAVASLLLFAVPGTGGASTPKLDRSAITIPRIDLMWEGSAEGTRRTDQEGFLKALEGAGFRVNRIPSRPLKESSPDKTTVLVLPAPVAKKLSPHDLPALVRYVEEGGILVTDTPSPLSKIFGIRVGHGLTAKGAYFHAAPALKLRWEDAPVEPYIYPAPGFTVLYRAQKGGRPLAVQFRRGKGTVVFFSALFDPVYGYGFSRYPHLAKILSDLGVSPPFSRTGVDAYFDAGYHVGEDMEVLAGNWEAWGIRCVHAAVWYMYDKPPFDYRRLVEAAHRHGILVYAWLMWPYVGRGFWDGHPEWRERNALLEDAHISFLYLMNLQNPDCRARVMADLQDLLRRVEFDGIDIAEFSIAGGVDQSLEGPSRPEHFVGLNDDARAGFKAQSGVDPIELFNRHSPHFWKTSPSLLSEFYSYRRGRTRALTEEILGQLSSFNRSTGSRLDLVMTIIDSTLHAEFAQLLALDLPATIRNTNRFGFSLQVEDAADEWAKLPDRYLALARRYAPLLRGRPLLIDINFEDCHPENQVGFPTTVPIGSEMHWLWRFAAAAASQVCFYAESQIIGIDWQTMPAAMASGSTIEVGDGEWKVDLPHTAYIKMQVKLPVALDGRPWPCRDGTRILMPKGKHSLTVLSPERALEVADVTLQSTTGELTDCKVSGEELEATIECDRRCISRFQGTYTSVSVDGEEAHPGGGAGGGWYLFTGAGRHTISIIRSDRSAGQKDENRQGLKDLTDWRF